MHLDFSFRHYSFQLEVKQLHFVAEKMDSVKLASFFITNTCFQILNFDSPNQHSFQQHYWLLHPHIYFRKFICNLVWIIKLLSSPNYRFVYFKLLWKRWESRLQRQCRYHLVLRCSFRWFSYKAGIQDRLAQLVHFCFDFHLLCNY